MKVVPETSNLNGYRGIASLTHILQYYCVSISNGFIRTSKRFPQLKTIPSPALERDRFSRMEVFHPLSLSSCDRSNRSWQPA
jgi:hypothetical protein